MSVIIATQYTADMQDYQQQQVWQRSHRLVLGIYRVSRAFPSTERLGLISQLRRAVLSVPTNIAEGARRSSAREYAHFLNIAEGSLSETQYLVLVSRDLGYIAAAAADGYLAESTVLLKKLIALRRKVQKCE